MYENNPYRNPVEDIYNDISAKRIGEKIRAMRCMQNLSQADLAEKLDISTINANRIQQYENGARKAKPELLIKIAECLSVEPSALMEPSIDSYIGAMSALFEMERLYDLRLKKDDNGQIYICFGESASDPRVSVLNQYLEEWYRKREDMENACMNVRKGEERQEISFLYYLWKWNFPVSIEVDYKEKSEKANKERINRLSLYTNKITKHLKNKKKTN